MAIRYVKDFEFPSAAGFTSSAPSKVTGPMFAKGGKVEKAPKGMMVVIGIGKPKGPMKKAVGGWPRKLAGCRVMTITPAMAIMSPLPTRALPTGKIRCGRKTLQKMLAVV